MSGASDHRNPDGGDPTVLWVATGNQKKRLELERLLGPLGTTVRTLKECPVPVEIVEDRPNFAGNAAQKAVPLAAAVGAPAIGDDSGICVDALDGAPGVRSARWAGPDATDRDRIDKLLAAVDAAGATAPEARRARFVCAICLAGPDGEGNTVVRATFQGECHGHLLTAPRGDGGFGYDPLFVPDGGPDHQAAAGTELINPTEKTFAELSAAEKDLLSHRGKALRQLLAQLQANPTLLR